MLKRSVVLKVHEQSAAQHVHSIEIEYKKKNIRPATPRSSKYFSCFQGNRLKITPSALRDA